MGSCHPASLRKRDVLTAAAAELERLLQLFWLLPYTPEVVQEWQRIVIAEGVTGKQTHDAHLAAIMQVHSVPTILTFNSEHFKRFSGVIALHPSEV